MQHSQSTPIPENPLPVVKVRDQEYLEDAKGKLIPLAQVPDDHRMRDTLVREKIAKVMELQKHLRDFKLEAMADIQAFIQLSAEKYGVSVGGTKGNVTLTTVKGDMRMMRQVSENLAFDEKLLAAKTLIDECIIEWSEGSRPEIQTLVQDAFQTDQQGKISTGRVLGLRRLQIADEKWKRAMEAISDSIHVQDTKAYVRFQRRTETGRWETIPLDLAAV
ncbi:DUF3164 family protein [Thalassospira marina]|uniref:Sulfate transporter n=1 Tax=Thalassospira marina TaxID=2048283 RepID=A0A2N3KY58_9PROT|nr:DUF3164 family protein [Thalassospira marina]PKR55501.1 sulfate transporter [Thalassospira marina]